MRIHWKLISLCALLIALLATVMLAGADGALNLPSSTVTIEEEAFYGLQGVDRINLPGTVRTIGPRAFGGSTVKEIFVPGDADVRICDDALANSPDAKFISDDGLLWCGVFKYAVEDDHAVIRKYLGVQAEVAVPSNVDGLPVKAIGESAFENNALLTGVTLPNGVTTVDHRAFRNCPNLASVQVPGTMTCICEDALTGSPNAKYTSNDGLLWYGTYQYAADGDRAVIRKYLGDQAEVAIPARVDGLAVTVIGENAFKNNARVTGVTVPDGVTTVDRGAFYNCVNLAGVALPDTLTAINDNAFAYCAALTDINFPAGLTVIKGDAFKGACTVDGTHFFNLPDGLTECSGYVFQAGFNGVLCVRRDSVTEGTIRAAQYTYTHYGETDYRYKWYNNEGERLMKYVGTDAAVAEIPAGIWLIDNDAFKDHTELTGAVIPEGVTKINHRAFQGCENLTSVAFPASLTTIDTYAFSGCGSAAEAAFCYSLPGGITAFTSANIFENCPAILLCDKDSDTAQSLSQRYVSFARNDRPEELDFRYMWRYFNHNWSVGLYDYVGPQTQVRLPDDCANVESERFRQKPDLELICAQLSETDAALSVAELNHTFPGHEGIRYRSIDGVLYVMGCVGAEQAIVIPQAEAYVDAGIDEQIRNGAFKNLATVTKAVIPEGVTCINADAFSGCENLTDITLPATLKRLGTSVFAGCGQNAQAPFYLVLPDGMEDLYGRGGGANTFADANAILVCGKTSDTAALLADRNYVYTCPGEYDFRYRYESYTENGETGRRLWLVGYVGSGAEATIPAGIYGIKRYSANREAANWATFYGDAFYGNETVTKVVVPEGAVTVKDSAFSGCVNLTDITLPSTMKSLETAFVNCGKNAAKPFYVFLPDNIDTILGNHGGANTFQDFYDYRAQATLVCGKETTTARTLSDGNYAFALREHYDDGLIYWYENREINGVTAYRLFVYDYVGESDEVIIPDDIGLYGVSRTPPGGSDPQHPAFYGQSIRKVVIPDGVAVVSEFAFRNCRLLTDITLPGTLKRIGNQAFENVGASANQRFIVVIPTGVQEYTGANGAGWSPFNGSGATLVAFDNSVVAGELFNNDWQFYSTLEDALAQRNIRRKDHDDPNYRYFGMP